MPSGHDTETPMKPSEYEHLIAQHFRARGYSIELTPPQDYGVDVFASKGETRIAVQAKMYGSSRPINREMIMQLHGAKDYFDCARAVIATDGVLTPDAVEVAAKLRIETLYVQAREVPHSQVVPKQLDLLTDEFELIWERHIMPLAGRRIINPYSDRANTIVEVNWGGLTRITSNGRQGSIPIEVFRRTVRHILLHGYISRAQININYAKRVSSGVVLVLAQVPSFQHISKPIGLRLRRHSATS